MQRSNPEQQMPRSGGLRAQMSASARAHLLSCLFLSLALAACSGPARPPASARVGPSEQPQSSATSQPSLSSTDVVKATAGAVELSAGGSADLAVRVQVANGYHINANPPTFPYLKATELSVELGEGLSAARPVYPPSVTRSFTFAEKPLAVYEGQVEIKLTLRAAASAAKGTRTLPVRLRVQACDDKACYPPGTLNIPVALTIK